MANGKGGKKNTTSASSYKAGGGSQAKSAKSPKTKGMSPSQIAGIAASVIPAGRAVKTGKAVVDIASKAAPGAAAGAKKIATGAAAIGGVVGAAMAKRGESKKYSDRASKQRAYDAATKKQTKKKP